MFGAMALGETAITGLLTGEDVLCTAAALRAMGAHITHEDTNQLGGVWRVRDPLSQMGARFEPREGARMPLAIVGTDEMVPIEYTLPMASAQVKSCVLLAGLNTAGETTVIEPEPTRDHTERMLRHFGAEVRVEAVKGKGKRITVVGWPELRARDVDVR